MNTKDGMPKKLRVKQGGPAWGTLHLLAAKAEEVTEGTLYLRAPANIEEIRADLAQQEQGVLTSNSDTDWMRIFVKHLYTILDGKSEQPDVREALAELEDSHD